MLGFFKKKTKIIPPVKGAVIPLEKVNDAAFSQKLLGDGFAVEPEDGTFCAPVDGEVAFVFHTGHAFGMKTETGVEVLVHIGIDTVELDGRGFNPLVEAGSKVKAGEPIIQVDLEVLKAAGKDTVTPVIITAPSGTLDLNMDLSKPKIEASVK